MPHQLYWSRHDRGDFSEISFFQYLLCRESGSYAILELERDIARLKTEFPEEVEALLQLAKKFNSLHDVASYLGKNKNNVQAALLTLNTLLNSYLLGNKSPDYIRSYFRSNLDTRES